MAESLVPRYASSAPSWEHPSYHPWSSVPARIHPSPGSFSSPRGKAVNPSSGMQHGDRGGHHIPTAARQLLGNVKKAKKKKEKAKTKKEKKPQTDQKNPTAAETKQTKRAKTPLQNPTIAPAPCRVRDGEEDLQPCGGVEDAALGASQPRVRRLPRLTLGETFNRGDSALHL